MQPYCSNVKHLLPPLILAALLLGSCTTTYRVQVDALANPALAAAKRTYAFATTDRNAPIAGDLRYGEVLRQVDRALTARGFQAVAPGAAELNIFVDFGVGDPVTRIYTFSTPIYAELGGGYTTRTKQTTDAAGKTTTTTETVRVPGSYERVGTDVSTNSVTTYRKHLRLSARQREAGVRPEAGREVWTVTAVCDDQEADLRAALPLMAEALTPYIAADTGRAIIVEFQEKDGELVPVKRQGR